jgi:hypothetical protein
MSSSDFINTDALESLDVCMGFLLDDGCDEPSMVGRTEKHELIFTF